MRHGIRINGSRFWVVHRARDYGPFDYAWSPDFYGVEFLYQGHKFGEYCSDDEIYADLSYFELPKRVYEVASIAVGTITKSILDGVAESERSQCLVAKLTELGFKRFAIVEPETADGPR